MDDLTDLLGRAAAVSAAYRTSLSDRPVGPPVDLDAVRAALGGPLPAGPTAPADVLDHLVAGIDPALVATAGPRYFGFVIGGSLPAATAAEMAAVGWDQNAFSGTTSPAALVAEEIAGGWLKELLGLPRSASVGFVTGGQAANTTGLAAARHHVLADVGWDVEQDGLHGAPPVRVVASSERHATVDRSLRVLGLGTRDIVEVAADANGAMDVADLARALADPGDPTAPVPTIVVAQSGNVNTGACDDLRAVCARAGEHGAWVHVDGAFGLWAAASPATAHLVDGIEDADSWACDGHKWLNVPYDCGYSFCARPDVADAALSYSAPYTRVVAAAPPALADFTLESSRRARGFATWAAIRELGRSGVVELVDRCCAHARRFATSLADGGAEIANEVVLNQVLVRFGDDDRTDRTIAAVQRDGTCWLAGTTWRGRRYMRISVSNWSTTEDDVDRSVEAILRSAATA
jgi:glutamate/tyrosine decarboxylase-like PLP-dependent enzyme